MTALPRGPRRRGSRPYAAAMPPAPLPTAPAPLRAVAATRYVTPLREGGSLPGLVEADDLGLYVVKFRAAGQGLKALVAEVVAGELARALGLPVPELVLVDLDPDLARAEPDFEVQELAMASAGVNLGMDYLPGSVTFSPVADTAPGRAPDPALAADVVWFDGLVTNVDRTPRNPNLLVWHRRLHLIDHGAALYVHHSWREPAKHARQPFAMIRDHVLLRSAGAIPEADERLAARVDEALLRSVLDVVPGEWLEGDETYPDPEAHRRAYVDYLLTRLAPPRPFVAPAEESRRG